MAKISGKNIENNLDKIFREKEGIARSAKSIEFGKIVMFIQNSIAMSKAITKTIKEREKVD